MKWFLLLGFRGERVKPMGLETNLGLGILTVRTKVRVWAAPFVHSSSPIINFLNAFLSGHQRYSRSLSSLQGMSFVLSWYKVSFNVLCFFLLFWIRVCCFKLSLNFYFFIMRWRRREEGEDYTTWSLEMEERWRAWCLGGRNGDEAGSLLCFWCFPGIFALLLY